MEKIVRIATDKTPEGRAYSIFCKITIKDGELSITGVEGPTKNGGAIGGCGQIVMSLDADKVKPVFLSFWSRSNIRKFLAIWKRWHLNHMIAGSPAQETFLRANPIEFKHPESHYTKACETLTEAGLNPDPGHTHNSKPYEYGSAWLKEELPKTVIHWLSQLPDTDITPAWV